MSPWRPRTIPGELAPGTMVGEYCDTIEDGCGGVLHCGTCKDPKTCGGGVPNVCGQPD